MPIPTPKLPPLSPRTRATTPRLHTASDLSRATFAAFGDVVSRPTGCDEVGLKVVDANQGSARKWVDVSAVTNFYGQSESGNEGRCVVNLFVCRPRELVEQSGRDVLPVKVLERHPFTAQMFVPMGVSGTDQDVRYLVIVAPTLSSQDGGVDDVANASTNDDTHATVSASTHHSTGPVRKGPGLPDLDNIKAFIARGDQAVSYAVGTWHAPMVVLGQAPIDFVVIQHSNGVEKEDCQEFYIGDESGNGIAVDVGRGVPMSARLGSVGLVDA